MGFDGAGAAAEFRTVCGGSTRQVQGIKRGMAPLRREYCRGGPLARRDDERARFVRIMAERRATVLEAGQRAVANWIARGPAGSLAGDESAHSSKGHVARSLLGGGRRAHRPGRGGWPERGGGEPLLRGSRGGD